MWSFTESQSGAGSRKRTSRDVCSLFSIEGTWSEQLEFYSRYLGELID